MWQLPLSCAPPQPFMSENFEEKPSPTFHVHRIFGGVLLTVGEIKEKKEKGKEGEGEKRESVEEMALIECCAASYLKHSISLDASWRDSSLNVVASHGCDLKDSAQGAVRGDAAVHEALSDS